MPASVTLYQDAPLWSLPASEPDCIAAHALLRFAGVPTKRILVKNHSNPAMTGRMVLPVMYIHSHAASETENGESDDDQNGDRGDDHGTDGNGDDSWRTAAGVPAIRDALLNPYVRRALALGHSAAGAGGSASPPALPDLTFTAAAHADTDAYTALIRERLDLARLYEWWHVDENYFGFTHAHFADLLNLPYFTRFYAPKQERSAVRARLAAQSAAFREAVHTGDDRAFWSDEVDAHCLAALDARLAAAGECFDVAHASTALWSERRERGAEAARPGYLDAVVYGHLSLYLRQDGLPTRSRLKTAVARYPRLVRFVERIRDAYFADASADAQSDPRGAANAGAVSSDDAKPRAQDRAARAKEKYTEHERRRRQQRMYEGGSGSGGTGGGATSEDSTAATAEAARQTANRNFVLLAVGSFIFYALFGSAVEFSFE